MSTWKTAVGTFVALGGIVGLLAATGVIRVGKSSEEADDDDKEEGDGEEGEDKGKHAKGRKKGKRGKGKRRRKKKGKGSDLDSLGYVGVEEIRPEDRAKVGVIKNEPDKTWGELSLFNPCAWGKKYVRASGGKILREAQLIDMNGKVLHRWESDFASHTTRGWAMAKIGADGNLYAVNARTGFVKLDWDSKQLWGLEGGYHHDFEFGPDGNIWVLYEKKRPVTHDGQGALILDNGFAIISPDGKLIKELSMYDVLKDDDTFKKHLSKRLSKRKGKGKVPKVPETEDDVDDHAPAVEQKGRAMDIFHANTLDFLGQDAEGLWKKGDVLTSMREMDMVAVFDPATMELKWKWGPGDLDRPHDPSQLANGHVLIFDNGMHRKYSRVVEIDPSQDNKVAWEYRGNEKDPFFSSMRGLAQRLDNDNVLITSSQQGRVFEVDREGNIVWEFWGTYVLGGKLRVPIRLLRLHGDALAAAHKQLKEKGGTAGKMGEAAAAPAGGKAAEGKAAEGKSGDTKDAPAKAAG